jgi:3-dehydroquinate synthase
MKNSKNSSTPIMVRIPGASYPIHIEEGLLGRAGEVLAPLITGRKIFILSDSNVWDLWGKQLARALAPHPVSVILVAPGEQYKRLETVESITDELALHGAERSSVLIAFGGGVVGDMGAFAASIFLRGIDCIQIPTTLLAQVDSAIGGKTGVNLAVGKNLVGTFSQPKMVLSDPKILRTLPERELRAGLFEAIKCGVIGDPALFQFLDESRRDILKGKPAALEPVIRSSAALKALIVSKDEKEGDLRRVLNFGHTVGHALEAATGYKRFLHGEAVAWGMLAATRIAWMTDGLGAADANRIANLIGAYGPVPTLGNINTAEIARHMAVDKKVRDGKIHFVLPRRIGEVTIVKGVSHEEVGSILDDLRKSNPFSSSPRRQKAANPKR